MTDFRFKLVSKTRPELAYRKRNNGVFSDPIAKMIFDHHMHVIGEAKHYFFLLYGNHEFLTEVLDVLMRVDDLDGVVTALGAYQKGDLLALEGLGPELSALVVESGKKRSKGFVSCKTNLIFSLICSLRCYRSLQKNRLSEAIKQYGQSAYYLGGCIGIGTVLFGDESVYAVAQRGASKRHEGNRAARAWVAEEWKAHRAEYENNKSAFARDYVGRLRHEFGVRVTDKQLREVWLSETHGRKFASED